jgi:predicted enzyme related to lactoylglutathione lyase
MATQNVGQFVWHDHLAKDPKAAVDFYTDVLGWKTEPFGAGSDYTVLVGSQGPLGGTMKLPEEAAKMGTPPHWMGHVLVDNVDQTAERAKALGGRVYKEPADIPNVGRFAVIGDPQGADISIFQPKEAVAPHDITKEGEFCWNELMTSDQEDALRFYSELFGWKKMSEEDMGTIGTYIVFGDGKKGFGGIMKLPKGMPMPPTWVYYTETSSLENTIGRATGKGATVMNGPMEVPGGGHVAQLMDPEGAMFALHEAGP